MIMGARIENITRAAVALAAILGVPLLTVLASLAWSRRERTELPLWRNALGAASMTTTATSWLMVFLLILLKLAGWSTRFYTPNWDAAIFYTAAAGTCLALTLKGPARLRALAAGALMVALFYAISVP